ncbi:hypothetical protein MUCCIDRAFT_108843 [Mucor lusitanicus CBS 277.49]|uniref:Uncharacterized protein n=1 Tax=Mucor lusitanicus CBS 277.49 TaxID=747725 RepID=A0A168MIP5_MUCCL|nr:hypothetical protein MUCCIDRAFT_108843 [Mucor lusitanicus CBS 277.49]
MGGPAMKDGEEENEARDALSCLPFIDSNIVLRKPKLRTTSINSLDHSSSALRGSSVFNACPACVLGSPIVYLV